MAHLARYQSAGPLIGFAEQVFCNSQINRSRIGIDVPEESGKVNQPTIRIDSLAIPSKQRSDSKGTAEIMEARTGDTWRDVERQLGDEIMKVDANSSFADAARFRKGEQRYIRVARVAVDLLDIVAEALSEIWSKRDDPTLSEFGFPNEKCTASEIDVAQIQANDLANTQPQPIKHREYSFINQCPVPSSRVIREPARQIEKPPCIVKIKHVWYSLGRFTPGFHFDGVVFNEFVNASPFEKYEHCA